MATVGACTPVPPGDAGTVSSKLELVRRASDLGFDPYTNPYTSGKLTPGRSHTLTHSSSGQD
jgi:hypothetical protein